MSGVTLENFWTHCLIQIDHPYTNHSTTSIRVRSRSLRKLAPHTRPSYGIPLSNPTQPYGEVEWRWRTSGNTLSDWSFPMLIALQPEHQCKVKRLRKRSCSALILLFGFVFNRKPCKKRKWTRTGLENCYRSVCDRRNHEANEMLSYKKDFVHSTAEQMRYKRNQKTESNQQIITKRHSILLCFVREAFLFFLVSTISYSSDSRLKHSSRWMLRVRSYLPFHSERVIHTPTLRIWIRLHTRHSMFTPIPWQEK